MGSRPLLGSLLCSLAAACFAGTARAEQTGIEIGGRLGYGLPFGNAVAQPDTGDPDDDSGLDQFTRGMVPFWLDLGARVMPELMVGGFLQLGVGLVGEASEDACETQGVDCSVVDVRIGIQLHYHPLPFQQLDPWFGAGVGYEWLTTAVSAGGVESSTTLHGFELANLQAGLDFAVGHSSGIGPFVSFSLGQYHRASFDTEVRHDSEEIPNKALHEWLVLGLRGTFVL